MKFDRDKFFDLVREYHRIRTGKGLSQEQVDGIKFLLTSFEGQEIITDIPQIAYCFATIAHETAWTFQPITEYGGRKYFDKYDTGRLAAALGNTPEADGDGFLYRGRGYVQLTGRRNYEVMSDEIGVDLVTVPDRALQAAFAFPIMVHGMTKGLYTGKKLSDYINASQKDYQRARRIINGNDKAKPIASLAMEFEKYLRASSV